MLTRFLALIVACVLPVLQTAAQETVRINEFLASNSSYAPVGSPPYYSDWIEIHNFGNAAVNLNGWHLTDSENLLTKFQFPSVTVPAGGYLLVFASGTNKFTPRLEAAFNLNVGGEFLALVKPDGQTIVSVFTNYPPQFHNISFGIDPQGRARYFAPSTPGAANTSPPLEDAVAKPRFSVERGMYEAPFTLTLSTETAGAVVRYNTNGVVPTATSGFLYEGPIQVGGTTPVTARAFRAGWVDSEPETHTYFFLNDVPQQAPTGAAPAGWPSSWGGNVVNYGMDPDVVNHPVYGPQVVPALRALPTFSIVMSLNDLFGSSGIYSNPGQDGRAWERPCSIELIYPDGRDGFQINGGIRIRGGFSRSTGNPKHAFRLFFREDYGVGELAYPLFGPGAADTFENFDLRTFQNYSWSFQGDTRGVFIRDVFSRDTQLDMGHQGERGDYYHLYINGMYWGIFNTCERPEASYGETYFGGDKDNYDVIKVEAGSYAVNATDGNMTAWTALYNMARAGFTNDAVYYRAQGLNPDGTENPNYPVYLDLPNLIDYMLVILYGGNLDAPISNFLGNDSPNNYYGMRDRTARMGFKFFVHDAEHTLLNVNEDRTGPYSAGNSGVTKSNPQYIWQKLMDRPEFRMLVADHVHRHFFNNGALTPQAALARFNQRTNELHLPVIAESARWGDAHSSRTTSPLGQSHWLSVVSTIQGYMNQRSGIVLNQLRADGLYPATVAPTFSQFGGAVNRGYRLTMNAPAGTIYYTLDSSDPRLAGGAISPGAQVYSGALTINESAQVKARARTSAGVWSALNEAPFMVIQNFTELVITEISYNPTSFNGRDGDDFEFIELKNTSNRDLDLSGVEFAAGIQYTFPNGTELSPGQFIVLASNAEAFRERYPNVRLDGVYTNNLSNGGENVTLRHAAGGILATLSYGDDAPWPESADGEGFTLVVRDANSPTTPTTPADWRASSAIGGSPGRDDPLLNIPSVWITEALTSGAGAELDALELYNPGDGPADISGWFLTDSRGTPKKFRIPANTIIGAGQYLVFDESDFNPTPGIDPSFALSSAGEEVHLFSADAAGNLTGYSTGFQFGGAAPGVSFGRHATSDDRIYHPAQKAQTLGAVNAGPLIGPLIINELRYASFGGAEEFIEIKNISGATVPLFDPARPENRWRIEGVDFDFPPGVELGAGELLVVAGSDATAFRSRYAIPAHVQVFGPYHGSLQDNGELVSLVRPGVPATDPTGTIVPRIAVDEVWYDNTTPWPVSPFDPAFSLERVSATSYGNDPTSWRASVSLPSPGFANDANRPPRASAGLDVEASHTVYPAAISVAGSALDDGQPAGGQLSLQWTFVSGPAPVYFDNANSANATAFVPGAGTYILRFTASDGEFSASDEMTITLSRPTGPQVLLSGGSVWRYLDNGSDQGTAWRANSFNDAGWAQGPAQLGYGNNGEVTRINFGPNSGDKYRTYYFRRTFNVQNAASVEALTARLIRDDGAILYINGVEVLRVNMPDGPVNYRTFATSVVNDGADERTFYEYVIDTGALRTGVNVAAVEIHQVNAGSSDLSFDLELVGAVFPNNTAPTVTVGPDQVITLPATASLNGLMRDDALPQPPGFLTATWSKVSGPGTVNFLNASLPVTSASFSEPGLYTLRLRVADGALSAQDDLVIDVRPGAASPYEQWRAQHFTEAERANPAISGDNADLDSDTHTNMQEFIAGTDPRNPASVLELAAAHSAGGLVLRVGTAPGKSYTIQATSSLVSPVWERVADIDNATGGVMERTDPAGDSGARYYRIVTPRVP